MDGLIDAPLFPNYAYANAVAIQQDGKIVVAGYAYGASSEDFALARFNPDGTLDSTFDGDGRVLTSLVSASDRITSIAIQADGKIVAAGIANDGQNDDFALARFNADGSLDISFDGDGKLTTSVSPAFDQAKSVAVQPDGKIVVAGYATVGSNDDFAVVRYNADGPLDTSFDGDGKVTTPVLSSRDQAFSVALQPDGKIVAGGYSTGSGEDFSMVRYNTDGSLDTSFDGDGKVTTLTPASLDQIRSIAVLPGGKILASGHSTLNTYYAFSFARYKANGSLDTGFDTDGRATVGVYGQMGGSVIDGRNRVVAVGANGVSVGTFAIARILVSGPKLFDYDGDGLAELSVFRPSTRVWYTQSANDFTAREWGEVNDRLAPADYDGDLKTDVAVFRPSNGTWYVLRSGSQTVQTVAFGQDGDLPVPTDRDADGKAEMVLFRPSTDTWHTRFANGTTTAAEFGVAGDKPLRGDFDGDGRGDNANFRPSNHNWYLQRSTAGFTVMTWGEDGDVPVPADYDGDGWTDIAVYRPALGRWYIIGSSAGWTVWNWGEPGDIPVPADYDGDDHADLAIFRPSTSTWYIINTTTGYYIRAFGNSTDVPTPSAFNY